MTKQKFYEECILKSYQNAAVDSPLYNQIEMIGGCCPDNFNELIMKLSIAGIHIPVKENFIKYGKKYLFQLIGFAMQMHDDEFTDHLFSFLKMKSIMKLIDLHSEDDVEVLYWFYYEAICGEYEYRELCKQMADYILRNCQGTSYHKKVITLSKAFGLTQDVGLFELISIEKKANSK